MTTLCRPGTRWRLLAHEVDVSGRFGTAHHVTSQPGQFNADELQQVVELPETVLDEVVVDRWLHLEQLSNHMWWLDIGGVTIHVTADRDGRPRRVTVHGPGDWNDPQPGCRYELAWSADNDFTVPAATKETTP